MSVAAPPPEPEQIEADAVERLIALAEQGRLDAAAQRRVAPLLRTLLWLQHSLLETRISLAKLKPSSTPSNDSPTIRPAAPR